MIEPTVYMELMMSLLGATVSNELTPLTMGEILYAAAQPEATAVEHDILEEVRAELTDWTQSDLAGLKECILVQIELPKEDKHDQVAQIIRLATERGWHWSQVHSARKNLDDVITMVGARYIPEGVKGKMLRQTGQINLDGNFKKNIEHEVDSFRAELDRLFPSVEEGGT
jgi:hypothetical protein